MRQILSINILKIISWRTELYFSAFLFTADIRFCSLCISSAFATFTFLLYPLKLTEAFIRCLAFAYFYMLPLFFCVHG